jgi:hypothetical protein
MSTKEQRQFLEEELARLIKRFKGERDRHKKKAVLLKALAVSLAGLVTILLGLKVPAGSTQPILANIALVLGAVITVVSAYEAFFDPRTLWVRDTIVFVRLTDLQRDLAYATAGAQDGELVDEALKGFKARLDAVLEESLKGWSQLRGQEAQPTSPPSNPRI